MIVVFLLCVVAGTPTSGQVLDVCATCHPEAKCDNKPDGSGKVCNCKYGFVGNGITFCQDKDECQIGAMKICGPHTKCHNTYGSYDCTCLSGYNPSNNMTIFIPNDGTNCQDIDECRITGLCGDGGWCRNLEGSFECSCQVGYQVQDGTEPFHPYTGKASCKVVDCGQPASVEDTVLLSATGTTYGSVATWVCDEGFIWGSGHNTSVCGADGLWSGPTMVCEDIDECRITGLCGDGGWCRNLEGSFECSCQVGYQVQDGTEPFHPYRGKASCKVVDCGQPASVEDTVLLSATGTTYGSIATWVCDEGFIWGSGHNTSVCGADGLWSGPTMVCEAKCGPVPFLANSEVVWHNRSVVMHRCVDGYHSWRGSSSSVCGSSGTWQPATLRCIEIKPAISHVHFLNEKCVQWKAEKYEEDSEDYRVTYTGTRDYQRSFRDEIKQYLSSKAEQLKLCLHLLPATNYSISITALSARFTASITTNTSLPEPPVPVVYYREFDTPVPTLRLNRSANTLDPISLYQVFVLPEEGIMVFDCSSPGSADPLSKNNFSSEYITAQILIGQVGTQMDFTVGDGLYYGGFYNAPLKKGRTYYIILRAVSQWKTTLKSSCVLWAKVTGTSYVLMVSSLSAAAAVGLVAFVILGGYSCIWLFKKK
ncbi:sushi domain-containing protein 1 isoform X3 [Limanda limanda]|uniref:sushi domain-containing protein 1 isoform X3 n=1 Tax=Limanda limanda TaxID=27771 RepID=UPI0029C706C2|nr:sushi domain-containing protein 1 isoform X3 [Limanda limanda]